MTVRLSITCLAAVCLIAASPATADVDTFVGNDPGVIESETEQVVQVYPYPDYRQRLLPPGVKVRHVVEPKVVRRVPTRTVTTVRTAEYTDTRTFASPATSESYTVYEDAPATYVSGYAGYSSRPSYYHGGGYGYRGRYYYRDPYYRGPYGYYPYPRYGCDYPRVRVGVSYGYGWCHGSGISIAFRF